MSKSAGAIWDQWGPTFLSLLTGMDTGQKQQEATQSNLGRYDQGLWATQGMLNDSNGYYSNLLGNRAPAPQSFSYDPISLNAYGPVGKNSYTDYGGIPPWLLKQSNLPGAQQAAGMLDAAGNRGYYPVSSNPNEQPAQQGIMGGGGNIFDQIRGAIFGNQYKPASTTSGGGQTPATSTGNQQGGLLGFLRNLVQPKQAQSANVGQTVKQADVGQMPGQYPTVAAAAAASQGQSVPNAYTGGTFEGVNNGRTRYGTAAGAPTSGVPSSRSGVVPGNARGSTTPQSGYNYNSPSDLANAGTYGADTSRLVGDYNRRMNDTMGLLAGLGQQASKDISTQFNNAQGNALQDLQSRGLGGSTINANIRQGMASQESQAQNRLNESLRGQQADALAKLSGDVLGQRSDQVTGINNLSQQAFNNQQQLQGQGLNWIGQRSDMYPQQDYSSLIQSLQANNSTRRQLAAMDNNNGLFGNLFGGATQLASIPLMGWSMGGFGSGVGGASPVYM